jgi:hypothetical protein
MEKRLTRYWDNYLKYHHVKTEYDAHDHVVGTEYSGDYSRTCGICPPNTATNS